MSYFSWFYVFVIVLLLVGTAIVQIKAPIQDDEYRAVPLVGKFSLAPSFRSCCLLVRNGTDKWWRCRKGHVLGHLHNVGIRCRMGWHQLSDPVARVQCLCRYLSWYRELDLGATNFQQRDVYLCGHPSLVDLTDQNSYWGWQFCFVKVDFEFLIERLYLKLVYSTI